MITSVNYRLNHPEVKDKLKDFIIALGKELSRENENNTTVPRKTVSVM
jgi:UTP--glucose-1-phosphate uridylyltransferase